MKNDLDNLLNQVFGRRSNLPSSRDSQNVKPTADRQPARPNPKQPSPSRTSPQAEPLSAENAAQSIDSVQRSVLEMQKALNERAARQKQDIAALNKKAAVDIRRIEQELASPQVQALAQDETANAPNPPAQQASVPTMLAGFSGLEEALSGQVLGQADFCRALAIALKRPYVMGYNGSGPRSAFLVTGPKDTGRHLGLQCAAAHLAGAGVFSDATVQWVDLALYPTATEEKLFLQDLYRAFAAPGDLVVFERETACHVGFLPVLEDLVNHGFYSLPGRYVEQNGKLVDSGGALVKEAVSRLTPRNKYLVFLTSQSPAQVAGRFGGPFLSALGDVCETHPFKPEARRAIAQKELDGVAARARDQLSLELVATPAALQLLAEQGGKSEKGCTSLLTACADIYRAMAQYRLTESADALAHAGKVPVPCKLDTSQTQFTLAFGQEPAREMALFLPARYQGDVQTVRAQLQQIVGLEKVKKYILSLEQNYSVQKRRAQAGLKTASVSMHMIFTGNPGTGKTTIARLVGQYLKAIGVLSGGQLIEASRADLVGRFVGHTAPQTTAVIRSALGGVLFIDEAYSLYRGKDDNFGLEAIDTLVKGMEDHRDDFLVILAGYTHEMEKFLQANSGLKSRFPNTIEFPDYTAAQLLQIATIQAQEKGYTLDEQCNKPLLAYFEAVQAAHARNAGNGRLARNKVEEAILAQSRRVAADPGANLSLLLLEDFSLADDGR